MTNIIQNPWTFKFHVKNITQKPHLPRVPKWPRPGQLCGVLSRVDAVACKLHLSSDYGGLIQVIGSGEVNADSSKFEKQHETTICRLTRIAPESIYVYRNN